jgi:hypothetical protein
VSLGRRYLLGLGGIAGLTLGLGLVLPPAGRAGLLLALGTALLVQGPLGWWVVRAVGTPRFLAAWSFGMLIRVLLLGLMGLVVVPALGWPAPPALIGLAALLLALLFLEGAVLLAEQSRAEAR